MSASFYQKTLKKIRYRNSAFVDATLTPAPETLEGDLHAKFLEGYEKLRGAKRIRMLIRVLSWRRLCQVTKNEKTKNYRYVNRKEEELICTLNTPYKVRKGKLTAEPFFAEMELRLKKMAHQTLTVLPETVMKEVILKNNASFLLQHCPLLSREEQYT